MAWSTPKTDWVSADVIGNTDLNRIEENTRQLGTITSGVLTLGTDVTESKVLGHFNTYVATKTPGFTLFEDTNITTLPYATSEFEITKPCLLLFYGSVTSGALSSNVVINMVQIVNGSTGEKLFQVGSISLSNLTTESETLSQAVCMPGIYRIESSASSTPNIGTGTISMNIKVCNGYGFDDNTVQGYVKP
jgi:hypothetical protein